MSVVQRIGRENRGKLEKGTKAFWIVRMNYVWERRHLYAKNDGVVLDMYVRVKFA